MTKPRDFVAVPLGINNRAVFGHTKSRYYTHLVLSVFFIWTDWDFFHKVTVSTFFLNLSRIKTVSVLLAMSINLQEGRGHHAKMFG